MSALITESCNRCGGELVAGQGVVALLACESCGREIPAAALPLQERRLGVESTRFFHQDRTGNTVLVAAQDGVELHTRIGEVRLSWDALEWLLVTGGPAAIDARRRERLPGPATPAARAAA